MKAEDELTAPEAPEAEKPKLAHERMMQVGQVEPPDKRISLVFLLAIIVFLGLAGGWPLLVVVLSIVVMIVLHETGHYIAAKRSGMKVTEFFLGFGPKLWSFQRGETEYGVKAIPAGAYVRIIGMNNLDEVAPEDEPRTYRQQSYPKRVAVAVAGSAMHFLQAIVCLFLAFTLLGTPGGHVFTDAPPPPPVIGEVSAGSAAAAADLHPGDRIVSIDGEAINDFERLHDVLVARAGKTITLEAERNGQRFTATTTLGTDTDKGVLGVKQKAVATKRLDPVHAVGQTASEIRVLTSDTLGFFGSFFSPSGISDFAHTVFHPDSGPTVDANGSSATTNSPSADENRPISIIGAARIGSELTRAGPLNFVLFFASINVVIGLFNLIPLLPLDGGHLAIATYERLRSRRGRRYQADVMKLLPLTYAVVMVLILLGISTIFLDIFHPINLN